MKVILLRDVAKVGRKGEVCEVPSGHAINLLIPRKLAVPATTENISRHKAETARRAQDQAQTADSFQKALDALKEKTITYTAGANAQGHLFKGIRAADIAGRLTEEGYPISEQAIVLEHPIKDLGTHTIPLKQGGIEGVCTLEVVKQ